MEAEEYRGDGKKEVNDNYAQVIKIATHELHKKKRKVPLSFSSAEESK